MAIKMSLVLALLLVAWGCGRCPHPEAGEPAADRAGGGAAVVGSAAVGAADAVAGPGVGAAAEGAEGLAEQARASLDAGVKYLLDKQLPDGSWLQDPAVTALVATALVGSGSELYARQVESAVAKGRLVILQRVQADGSFQGGSPQHINYTTATCLYALAMINDPRDKEIMRRARHFLIDLQLDEDHPEHPTSRGEPFHGGIGYGSAGPDRPDLSNTAMALEALYVTDYLDTEEEGATPEQVRKAKLAWENAIGFLRQVQNIPKDAEPTWLVNANAPPEADGGFFYKPDESKASGKAGDAESLRSYGSMTYAGLKSMLYARLDKDDFRVKAATEWGRRHYTLEENPGMGPEGHYYYVMTFAKAFAVLGEESIEVEDGNVRQWRQDLLRTLIALQKPDGSWQNDRHGRWMEGIPELVTAYALIALKLGLGL